MMDEPRIEIWKQYKRTQDAPYRRKDDRRVGFRVAHAPGGRVNDWPFVMGLIGRHAVHISTFYDRHLRRRVIQVHIGDRAALKERFGVSS